MSAPKFHDRLAFDPDAGTLYDGEIRYLMIRPDALMGLFKLLPAARRAEALDAFANSVCEHGGRSAQKYRAMGAVDGDKLLAVIVETAPQLGWGSWTFVERAADRLVLEVRNSPFAQGHGRHAAPVCAPIAGMLRAVAGLVLGGATTAEETGCACQGEPSCRFVARLA
jgi:predicted hydrocarbon binding protein